MNPPDKNPSASYATEMSAVLLLLILIQSSVYGEWQDIAGRDGVLVYRINAPPSWWREDPPATTDLSDTREAICSFGVDDLQIHLHNFPSPSADRRIPAQAQVNRWLGQFEQLSPVPVSVTPTAFSGFAGLYLSAEGSRKGESISVLGWSLLLDPIHYLTLSRLDSSEQMRADITIKISGSPLSIGLHRDELEAFAESFELINGIPMRL